jgi:hypothetical protein
MNIDTSLSNSSVVQPDVIQVSQTKRNRMSLLLKRNHAKQCRIPSAVATKRKKISNGHGSDVRRAEDDETESEMEL